ncbi:MAG: hypothetical protein ABH868_03905 [bacterium]
MWQRKCVNCSEYKNCKDSFSSWIFFLVGIIATIAIRIVTVLIYVNPLYGKIAWYIGVGGFFIFFMYKYRVNSARSKLIEEKNLVAKINNQKELSGEDYSLIGNILCGLSSKKETINYIFIFGLSAVVLLLAIYIDFIK